MTESAAALTNPARGFTTTNVPAIGATTTTPAVGHHERTLVMPTLRSAGDRRHSVVRARTTHSAYRSCLTLTRYCRNSSNVPGHSNTATGTMTLNHPSCCHKSNDTNASHHNPASRQSGLPMRRLVYQCSRPYLGSAAIALHP